MRVVMEIRVGTIQEIRGLGYEVLVDSETRSEVLARFWNGQMMDALAAEISFESRRLEEHAAYQRWVASQVSGEERTLLMAS